MIEIITMPPLGDEAIVRGIVAQWLKQVGDVARRDEPLVVVESGDGARRVLRAPAVRFVKRIFAAEGEEVEIGEPLAVLSSEPVVRPDLLLAPAATAAVVKPEPPPPYTPAGDEEVAPLGEREKRLAAHMTRSRRISPHVATVVRVDVTEVAALRDRLAGRFRAQEGGAELTLFPFLLKSVGEALARFPAVNAQLVGENVHRKRYVHTGFDVWRPPAGEWVTPVVRDVDTKSVLTLARETADLIGRARSGALAARELRGATFSVTHSEAAAGDGEGESGGPAGGGVLYQTPILRQPQAAILAIGPVLRTPVVGPDDRIVAGSQIHLCLSHDARIVDGETAVRFLQDIQRTLEETRFLFA
jgi:pyruvate/2-oxoglutarate dehydrogenase complex dihydrolipoamide acyltransferase (E2) component